MIREAGIDDMVHILDMARELHKESDAARWEFNAPSVIDFAVKYIHEDNKVFLIDEKRRGFIMGYVAPYAFSKALLAVEEYWYVKPKFRGTALGMRLYNHFKDWAEFKRANEIIFGVATNIETEKFGEMMQKLGFRPVGGLYKKVV